jgi:hypothetical protein
VPNQPPTKVIACDDLSPAEKALLEQCAAEWGMTADELATLCTRESIGLRFLLRKPDAAKVIQFPGKGK